MTTLPHTLNVDQIRKDFPILSRRLHGDKVLVYLDSTATAQKPVAVIRTMEDYYYQTNANIHRGVHTLAEEATAAYEGARERIAKFIGARHAREVIFTRNTTEAINLVAYSWARKNLVSGDVIVLTEMEHHSNLVPWQILADERGIRLEFIPVTEEGELDLSIYQNLLELQPKLVAFSQMSNVLGTINPAGEMIRMAHQAGAVTLIDGAQSAPHLPVDVQELGADFLAFSAHKMCGPTGIGVLYGRRDLLEAMPPFLGGGDMIKKVTLRSFSPNELPHKFEAGTPAIAEVIGFGAAVDYLTQTGMKNIAAHEHAITRYALDRLSEISGLKLIGPSAEKKGGVCAFTMEGIHPHDIAQLLDREGIAVRAGHHCAMPLHQRYGLPATTRASFYLYNTFGEVDLLAEALEKAKGLFG